MTEGSQKPEQWPKGQSLAVAPCSNGPHAVEPGADRNGKDAFARALEAVEQLFFDQRARIAAEIEAARAAAEESDFEDYKGISHAAARAARVSWEADDQMAALKKRLNDLYEERVVEPIMEVRQLSAKMEERNKSLFRRRVGDRR